jgi:tetratricopeptide (TPR) repeat protein
MRKFTILYTLVLFSVIVYGQNGEEQNIKRAIQARSDANRDRNLEAWMASWAHDPQSSNTFISRNGYNTIKSWDSLKAMMENNIKQNPKPDNTIQVKTDNYSIHVDGDLATADYDVTFTSTNEQSNIFPYTSGAGKNHCHDVFIKENGEWKTRSRIVISLESYNPGSHAAEIDLNTAGYDLLFAKKVKEAIEVFKLNVKLHPESWNVYDSLGEAYAAAGDKKNAIANYEKSIELNPNSQSGKDTLAKLKQK